MASTHPQMFLTNVFGMKCFEEAYLSRFLARALWKSCAGLAPLVTSDDQIQGADGCGYLCSCPVPRHRPIHADFSMSGDFTDLFFTRCES